MSPTRRRRSSNRGGQRPTAAQLRGFWGDDTADDTPDVPADDIVEPHRLITPGVDPTALVQSLGPLPFPGSGLAQHYFKAVYDRAASLAVALAAAAGLLELSPSGELANWADDAELD